LRLSVAGKFEFGAREQSAWVRKEGGESVVDGSVAKKPTASN